MEKANKVLKPIVIVLGVLIIAMIALTVVVKVVGGKNKGTVSVESSGETEQGETEDGEDTQSKWSFDDVSITSGSNGTSGETETETETEEKKSAMDDPAAYILENSQTTALTDADLKDLTAEELYYAKYEIYARNGYVFEDAALNTYFTGKSWYTANADFTPDLLTDVEKTNFAYIETYATDNNLTYTP
ncbi:MAG: YARHG domain-containing protein [Lachnospiraceae bacterium]|nr:YARHG domain-containing protein [Lachnospiraceae bacterium]